MAEAFLGEIRIVGFNFAPIGWATCDGQLMSISQNTALFSLLGTNFGGNGQTNFGLPNLQGSAPMFWQQGPGLANRSLGETGGENAVTLITSQLPTHNHTLQGDREAASATNPNGNLAAGISTPDANLYTAPPNSLTSSLAPQAVSTVGNSQPHNNLAPYQTLLYVIALQGIYPSRP